MKLKKITTFLIAAAVAALLCAVGAITVYSEAAGAAAESHSHSGWKEWTSSTSMPTEAGNYYLTGNVVLSGVWEVPEGVTNLCLTGHTISGVGGTVSGSSDTRLIRLNEVKEGAAKTLNIFDDDGKGKITSSADRTISCDTGTTLTINGGIIENTSTSTSEDEDEDEDESESETVTSYVIYDYGANVTVNGGKIIGPSYGISVRAKGEVTVNGGEITSEKSVGVSLYGTSTTKATANIIGGTITGGRSGIYVGQSNTLTVSGGTIISTSSVDTDGAIKVYNSGASAEITGGIIEAKNTNGIYISSKPTVTISGGTITSDATRGIYNLGTLTITGDVTIEGTTRGVSSSGTLTVFGGKITSNTYGIYSSGTLKLSGSPAISGRTADFYLASKKYITLNGALGDEIYKVSMASYGVFTNTAAENTGWNDVKNFTPASSSYQVLKNYDGQLMFSKHIEDGIAFEPWSSTDSLPDKVGSYYLTEDVKLSASWTAPTGTTNICLNGHNITFSGGCISVGSGRTLNIYDCQDKGTITGATWGISISGGTVTVNGGTIIANSGNGANNNPGITMSGSSTLNIHGGTITSESSNGVYTDSTSSCTITMDGGTVTTKSSKEQAAFYVAGSSNVFISGGTISNDAYGGLSINNSGQATITGGTIYGKEYGLKNNGGTANVSGGTIQSATYAVSQSGAFNLAGKPTLTGDESDIYLASGKYITVTGDLTGKYTVLTENKPTAEIPVEFTNSTSTDLNSTSNFTSVNKDYIVIKNTSSGQLELIVKSTDGGVKVGGATVYPPSGEEIVVDDDGATLPPGSTVKVGDNEITLPDGGYIDKDGNVTLPEGGNVEFGDTNVKVPKGGTVKLDEKEDLTVPDGSVVQNPGAPDITIGDNDDRATVDEDGNVTLSPGGSAQIGDDVTVTVPEDGDTTLTPNKEGTVTVPDGSIVENEKPNIPDIEIGNNNHNETTVDEDGNVTLPGGGSAQIGDVTVTVPDEGGTLEPNDDGTVTVPDGSKAESKDGTITELPNGGTVDSSGEVTAPENSVTVGGTTVTAPDGETLERDEDGNVIAPPGSTVVFEDETEIELQDGGIISDDGSVEFPEGGSVKIGDTIVTVPEGGTVRSDGEGNITVSDDSIVSTPDAPDITIGDNNNDNATVDEDGSVTLPPNGSAEIGDTTVTVPDGGTLERNENGTVTVPDGSIVQSPGAPDITIGDNNDDKATVDEDGNVTLPGGGSAEIGDTTVTVPDEGGTIEPNGDGTVTVPDGSVVQNPGAPDITIGDNNNEGATVDEEGNVTLPPNGSAQIGDVTVTVPENGGTIETNEDGSVNLPGGSIVEKDGQEQIVPEDGAVFDPGSGSLTPNEPETDDPDPDDPESGTTEPDTTSPEPEDTTPEPDVTSPEPETTTSEPDVTSPEPEDTTSEPDVTSPEPETTTSEPDTTAPAPDITAPAPETTTPVSSTTTPVPSTTTPAPSTTTPAPSTTTPAPSTTTPAAAAEPDVTPDTDTGNVVVDFGSGNNVPNVSIDSESAKRLAEEVLAGHLTPDEKTAVENGASFEIILSVEIAEATVSGDDRHTVQAIAAEYAYTVFQYLNIDIIKVIDGQQTERVTELSTPVSITIDVPEELRAANRTFAVVRVHDGAAEILEDKDTDPNTITILTDRFSTYAIIYQDTANSDSNDNNLNTGVVMAIGPVIAAMLGVISTRKRK